jgi:hypothetical protein
VLERYALLNQTKISKISGKNRNVSSKIVAITQKTASSMGSDTIFIQISGKIDNPIKYTDPDGRDSGYVTDNNGAGGFSHSGLFVELEGGRYAFFEVTGLEEGRKVGQPQTNDERDSNSEILSTSPLSLPTPKSGESAMGTPNGGVVRREFDSYDKMMNYLLNQKTGKGGYDKIIHFKTTPEQDAKILEAATNLGGIFSDYHLTTNHCGQWAEKVLTSPGTGIRSSNEWAILPKTIGKNLFFSNFRISWIEEFKR